MNQTEAAEHWFREAQWERTHKEYAKAEIIRLQAALTTPQPDITRLAREAATVIDNESRKPISSPSVPSPERQEAIASIIERVFTGSDLFRSGLPRR